MPFRNALMDRLGIDVPIIQAPMVGASDAVMAIAVSRTGGLGSLAAGAMAPQTIIDDCARIRGETDKPFSVNLFVLPRVDPDPAAVEAAIARLARWRTELGLPPQSIPNRWSEDFRSQFDALVEAAPPSASFTFGCVSQQDVARMKAKNIFVVGTATTVAEARAWADAGADAICAQGFESGGHRGAFLSDGNASAVGTMALVPAIRAAVPLPVIAAGGIMDGAGIAAALMLGADAVQMGTAFLLTPEAIISAPWRAAIRDAGDDPTRLTRVFSGRYARGIENRFMREMHAVEGDIPAYPVQNALTGEMRRAAAGAGVAGMLSLWAGQGVRAARPLAAGDLVKQLWAEAQEAIRNVNARL